MFASACVEVHFPSIAAKTLVVATRNVAVVPDVLEHGMIDRVDPILDLLPAIFRHCAVFKTLCYDWIESCASHLEIGLLLGIWVAETFVSFVHSFFKSIYDSPAALDLLAVVNIQDLLHVSRDEISGGMTIIRE